MPGLAKTLSAFACVLLAGLSAQTRAAEAQENPFIGTWSTTQSNGNITVSAFFDYFPNGTLHMSGPVSSQTGGFIFHECGNYLFNPAQSTLSFVFRTYTALPGEPAPPNIGQVQSVQYQFPNPNEFLFSDGTRYVRQPSNPWPRTAGTC